MQNVACNGMTDHLLIMKKDKIKNLLDFTPLIIMTVYAIILVWTVATSDAAFSWKHIVGLIILPLNFLLFKWGHKIGVIGLGLTLFLGLLSLLSFSHTITTETYGFRSGDTKIPLFYGQTIFLLWLLIHFIISARHYIGISTKKYWQELLKKS